MKFLNGAELAGFIKERQAHQARGLRQAWHTVPHLVIIQTKDDPAIDTYVALKKRYGEDIAVDVTHHRVAQSEVKELIAQLNDDESVHGIILQLPLADPAQTDELLDLVAVGKDVDGLNSRAIWDSATPVAITWLLAGYNIEIANKTIVIVGQGRLVGKPLAELWRKSGLSPITVDEHTKNSKEIIHSADILVAAAGVPRLITSDMVSPDTVVIDAGTSTEDGQLVGDLTDDVRERHDLTITPKIGGVGPLTIAALFDNVLRAAREAADKKDLA